MPNGEEACNSMAEEIKYTVDKIAEFNDKQINQFKDYQEATIDAECDSGLYESYKTEFANSDTYYRRFKSSNKLKSSDVIDTKKKEEGWPACKFLAFLLYIAKTKANISLNDIWKCLKGINLEKCEERQKLRTIRRNEAGEIEKIKEGQKNKEKTVIFADGIKTTDAHFLWNEENVSYAVPISDGENERPNCIKMIKLIHQRNKEIFAGFQFQFHLKQDSDEENNAMNEKNKHAPSNLNDIVEEAIDKNKQVIFTGAPGTGKTYTVRKFVKEHTQDESQYKFVQFHPSYDYSDFVEGLRPVVTKDSPDPTFVRLDGTFKQFCRSIVEKELETFCSGFRDLSAPEKREKLKDYYNAVKEGTFQGGKTAYYFLIDEINRADLSKVFGELMFGLEESYRGIKNRFDTQYKNLKTYQVDPDTGIASPMAFDCFADGFFIPKNLYLIGTMNDIDRSVESFDFALRRRFRWIDVKANEIMESSLKAMGVPNPEDIARRAIKMNNCLSGFSFGLGEAYHIGPAYFKSMSAGEKLKEDLKEVFSHRIEPLLREYTRGQNAGKVEELIQKCEEKLLENKTQGGE